MKTEPNSPARPKLAVISQDDFESPEVLSQVLNNTDGLSKREYFAAMAMQGLLAANEAWEQEESVATHAVKVADALIVALNQTKP